VISGTIKENEGEGKNKRNRREKRNAKIEKRRRERREKGDTHFPTCPEDERSRT
jgi:hypothetical protein